MSFSAITPLVFVMTRPCGARSGNCGRVGGRIHLVLAELGQRAVDLGEQQEAAEVATLVQARVALGLFGGGHPGDPLDLLECPPPGRHFGEDAPGGHLCRRARICDAARRPADLAERTVLQDVQTTLT